MSPSYGHTYLTSYGWAGTGTGLRKGAISKPLAIPPKKNLSGLGKDRDDAFPFWDHLFAAASKAITIKLSSGDEHEDPSMHMDATLQRTTTGILSNRRPISGTPASTSGSTTPSVLTNTNAEVDAGTGAAGRLSLLAIAKREAAKRGLYARFFRGPVLDPDQDPDPCVDSGASRSISWSPESTPMLEPEPEPEQVGNGQDATAGKGEIQKTGNKKRKSEDRAETQEERRERKRLKRERRAIRAAKKAVTAKRTKEKKNRPDRKDRKYRDEKTQLEQNSTTSYSKNTHKRARRLEAMSARNDLEQTECIRKGPPNNVEAGGALGVVLATKKKNGKRKDTPS